MKDPATVTTPARELADFAATLRFESIPKAVIDRTEDLFLDWFASALAGKGARPVEAIAEFYASQGPGSGPSEILIHRTTSIPMIAAAINAASSHFAEQDDVHDSSVFHPAAVVIPPQSEEAQQDNSLQGWPWVSGTFTWVEPTAWCLIALKRWRGLGGDASWLAERIAAGEAVLADRAIPGGGWNYGNPRVYGKVLSAFVPTTALALLALRDRPQMPVVVRGFAWLAGHRLTESSRSAMGLAAMCLDRFGADVRSLRVRLVKSLDGALRRGDTIAAAQLRAGLAGAQARDPFAI